MIGHAFLAIKIIVVIIGFVGVFKGKPSYSSLLLIPFFMSGVEMMSFHEEPWRFLFFGQSSEDDLSRALFGGSLMVALPFIIFALCGKDIAKLIELSETNSKPTIDLKDPK